MLLNRDVVIRTALLLLVLSSSPLYAEWPMSADKILKARRELPDISLIIKGTLDENGSVSLRESKVWSSGDMHREDRLSGDGAHHKWREIHCTSRNRHIFWSEEQPNIAVHLYDVKEAGLRTPARPLDARKIGLNLGGLLIAGLDEYPMDRILGNPLFQQVKVTHIAEAGEGADEISFLGRDGDTNGRVRIGDKQRQITSIEFWNAEMRDKMSIPSFHTLDDGSYFPAELTYSRSLKGKEINKEAWTIQIASYREQIPEKIFDLSGMDIPPGTIVHHVGQGFEQTWDGSALKEIFPLSRPQRSTHWTFTLCAVALGVLSAGAAYGFLKNRH